MAGLLAGALAATAAFADDPAAKDKKTKAETFAELEKEFAQAQEELQKIFNDSEKKQEEKREAHNKFIHRFSPAFLQFAKTHPNNPKAMDALILALSTSGGPFAKERLMDKVLPAFEPYVAKPEIKKAIPALGQMFDAEADKVLHEVIAKNPDHKIQASACKTLVQALENREELISRVRDDEQIRKRFEENAGKQTVEKLLATSPKIKKEAAALNKKLHENYGDIYPDVSVGRPAPEVEMETVEGKRAKLSELRGKVVVLDIWATWCGPCRSMIPHEREMVERLKDKPFALVSISADQSKATLTNFLAKEKMPWTHWWNGAEGGVLEHWGVSVFPTIYVLDANGIIRFTHAGVPGEELEKEVNKLVKEADHAKLN
jgi:thiol-disulfide isomerase/thioredoxin